MKVLTAAHHWLTLKLFEKYPENIGCIVSPGKQGKFKHPIPYALDNKAFSLYINGFEFDENALSNFVRMLEFYSQIEPPLFVAVPDVVCDPEATLNYWKQYAPVVADFGFKKAFVIQDGHEPRDVPSKAEMVFIGGSSGWKRWAIREFCPRFPCHVGRVNSSLLWFCHCAGAVSCDSSRWFRGDEA